MLKLKPSFLFKQKRGNGLGGSSVYELFLLVNEYRIALSIWQKKTDIGGEKRLYAGRKKGGVRKFHGATGDRCRELYPVSHSHMTLYRLIEID